MQEEDARVEGYRTSLTSSSSSKRMVNLLQIQPVVLQEYRSLFATTHFGI